RPIRAAWRGGRGGRSLGAGRVLHPPPAYGAAVHPAPARLRRRGRGIDGGLRRRVRAGSVRERGRAVRRGRRCARRGGGLGALAALPRADHGGSGRGRARRGRGRAGRRRRAGRGRAARAADDAGGRSVPVRARYALGPQRPRAADPALGRRLLAPLSGGPADRPCAVPELRRARRPHWQRRGAAGDRALCTVRAGGARHRPARATRLVARLRALRAAALVRGLRVGGGERGADRPGNRLGAAHPVRLLAPDPSHGRGAAAAGNAGLAAGAGAAGDGV
ncbi:MAG: Branched-chain amino acid ABC-type transport system, permease components, partial [uncultured Sphingomonadaceae bacterium]